MRHPVRGIGGGRHIAALHLVKALRAGLDLRQPAFDGKFDGANDAIRKSFPDKVKSKVPPGMMAIPEVATHRCSIGGTIRIVDPGQRSKRAKLGGASMKP